MIKLKNILRELGEANVKPFKWRKTAGMDAKQSKKELERELSSSLDETITFEFLNESRIKNVTDLEGELETRGVQYTEIDKSDRFGWKIKNSRTVIGTYEPGPKWLNLKDAAVASVKAEPDSLDLKIHSLLSDWVISSLDDYDKRNVIAKKLMLLKIPTEYKEVESPYMYRLIHIDKDDKAPFKLDERGEARSWAYHLFGITKMKEWYLEIYGKDESKSAAIVKKPISNVIINIPAFYSKFPKLLFGKKHSSLVFSEYEVICENKEPLITVKPGEWQYERL